MIILVQSMQTRKQRRTVLADISVSRNQQVHKWAEASSQTFTAILQNGKRFQKAKSAQERADSAARKKAKREREMIALEEKRRLIRSDPALYEQHKAKERERWRIRKLERKVKTIAEMTPREQRARRKVVRISTKKYLEKKKKQDVDSPHAIQETP